MNIREAYLLGIDAVVSSQSVPVDESMAVAERTVAEAETFDGEVPDFDVSREQVERPTSILQSEIPGISDEAWTEFSKAMKTAEVGSVSASNGHGMFEMKPRRLADLGLMKELSCLRGPMNRMVWKGEFVSPLTQKIFLKDPKVQYRAFSASMRKYVDGLRDNSIPRPDGGRPEGLTLSGALAVLHRCGPSGLKTWNDEENRFPDTVNLYQRANGIF